MLAGKSEEFNYKLYIKLSGAQYIVVLASRAIFPCIKRKRPDAPGKAEMSDPGYYTGRDDQLISRRTELGEISGPGPKSPTCDDDLRTERPG
jgi:hypothetical protein